MCWIWFKELQLFAPHPKLNCSHATCCGAFRKGRGEWLDGTCRCSRMLAHSFAPVSPPWLATACTLAVPAMLHQPFREMNERQQAYLYSTSPLQYLYITSTVPLPHLYLYLTPAALPLQSPKPPQYLSNIIGATNCLSLLQAPPSFDCPV